MVLKIWLTDEIAKLYLFRQVFGFALPGKYSGFSPMPESAAENIVSLPKENPSIFIF